jgi:outer membrane lipoprotein LolB
VAVTLLAGCALAPVAPPAARPQREAIAAFALSGRVTVNNGAESFAGRIEWYHGADGSQRIAVSSPLGQGLAQLTADRAGARLDTGHDRSYAAGDLDSLGEQVFGATLPLSLLPRWVLARVPPDAERLARDAHARPQSFVDGGWRVAYLAYESESAEALPTLIRASRGELEVRLKIDAWNLDPPNGP